ncbi:MAG: fasciclin domain-containing protein [Anaerolineae bacterium]|nr:fasciclin domain-containing protein [Anaerolineae bacterium]
MKRKTALFSSVLVLLAALSVVPVFAAPPGRSIVDVATAVNEETGEFSILIAALGAADPKVLRTLSGNGQFTVFAPTDAAFVALLGELELTADELLSNKALVTKVLLYHVARGRRDSGQVLGSDRIRTLQGGFLYQDGGVLTDANGRTSNIIAVDVPAANGIIHVIDTVVLPKL